MAEVWTIGASFRTLRAAIAEFIGKHLQPGATVLSGIIIAVGANCAARTFEPMFVGEGRFVWNLRNIVELQIAVEGTECELILSNAESVVVPVDASTQEQFFTSHKLGKEDCHALRRALQRYMIP